MATWVYNCKIRGGS
jgi:copper chaperone